MHITIFSFGFKYGYAKANYVFDLRFLPNPYWEPELRPYAGTDARVAAYVLEHPETIEFLALVQALLTFVCAALKDGKRQELSIACGCTGGRHRSVAISEHLAARLRQEGYQVACTHRDVLREAG